VNSRLAKSRFYFLCRRSKIIFRLMMKQ